MLEILSYTRRGTKEACTNGYFKTYTYIFKTISPLTYYSSKNVKNAMVFLENYPFTCPVLCRTLEENFTAVRLYSSSLFSKIWSERSSAFFERLEGLFIGIEGDFELDLYSISIYTQILNPCHQSSTNFENLCALPIVFNNV